jgi:hypothetical protein
MKDHLARIQIAIGIALGTLQTGGGCGPCPDHVVTVPVLPKQNGADAAPEPLPTVGDHTLAECQTLCDPFPGGVMACRVYLADGGGSTEVLECTYRGACGSGRRPAGLRVRAETMLARMAALEAASVDAFRILEGELANFRAPKTFLRACRRAARDEARHAIAMRRLAGSKRAHVSLAKPRRRSLEAIAIENAREGCVGEAWGALLAYVQARTATDPRVRHAMLEIAADEARHAALSSAIDAWIAPRLGERARARVLRAKRSHAKRLVREAAKIKRFAPLGLPSGPDARRIATELFASLGWS